MPTKNIQKTIFMLLLLFASTSKLNYAQTRIRSLVDTTVSTIGKLKRTYLKTIFSRREAGLYSLGIMGMFLGGNVIFYNSSRTMETTLLAATNIYLPMLLRKTIKIARGIDHPHHSQIHLGHSLMCIFWFCFLAKSLWRRL